MIEIVERRMSDGQNHEHIAEVKYVGAGGVKKRVTRQGMVDWLDESTSNKAVVYSRDRTECSYVGVVHRDNAPDYIRTYADKKWTDNLLALDEY